MLLDHLRRRVESWDALPEPRQPGHCPECGTLLVPRRGELVTWHWAHRPSPAARECLHAGESAWHLAMKARYAAFAGWEIERRITVQDPDPWAEGERLLILDAVNLRTGRVREFVHSLSPRYMRKHALLTQSGLEVRWILDGGEFISARAVWTRDGRGRRHYLKPRARDFAVRTGEATWAMEPDGALFHHWRHGIWYPNAAQHAAQPVPPRGDPWDALLLAGEAE